MPKPPRVVEDAAEAAPGARTPRKDYAPKPKPKYEDRPRPAPRAARADATEKRPYQSREDGDRPRPAAKPYAADRAPRAESAVPDDQPRKPRWSPDQKTAPRSSAYKSHGGSADKPARATGYKSHASTGTGYKPKAEGYKPRSEEVKPREDGERPARKTYASKGDEARPFVKREGAGKAAGFKSHATGGKKPFDKAGAKDRPAKPKTDARDTTKRFVPPKGPKR